MRITYLPISNNTHENQQHQSNVLRGFFDRSELSWYYQDEVESIATVKSFSFEKYDLSSRIIQPLLVEEPRSSTQSNHVEIENFS